MRNEHAGPLLLTAWLERPESAERRTNYIWKQEFLCVATEGPSHSMHSLNTICVYGTRKTKFECVGNHCLLPARENSTSEDGIAKSASRLPFFLRGISFSINTRVIFYFCFL